MFCTNIPTQVHNLPERICLQAVMISDLSLISLCCSGYGVYIYGQSICIKCVIFFLLIPPAPDNANTD